MTETCKNCLNAYKSPHDGKVYCWNKEWEAQFDDTVNVTVTANGTCGTYQRRREDQEPLVFGELTFDFEMT